VEVKWVVTWPFLFLAVLVVGAVLTAVIGWLRNDRHLRSQHRHLVLPTADHHGAFRSLLVLRAAVGLSGFGLAGLLAASLVGLPPKSSLTVAAAVGVICAAAAIMLIGPYCPASRRGERATAIRELAPGGYGQIRVEHGEHHVILAAQSADERPIPAGAEVEVFDCDRSVVRVRLAGTT
jgi:hypothetical protein